MKFQHFLGYGNNHKSEKFGNWDNASIFPITTNFSLFVVGKKEHESKIAPST